jgi:hypothetical protein
MPATSTNVTTTAATFNGVGPILANFLRYPVRRRYSYGMADDAILEKIQDDTREAGLRLRASLTLLHSQGMIDEADYRELALCLRTSLAMVEAAYMEARKRG